MIDLSIIIVNHNTRKMLLECLESIFGRTQTITYEVIVVDNESSDGSVEAVQAQFPQVKLIVNPVGRYFSAGNNQGIAVAQGRYIFALNPDTLVLGDTLGQLVRQMELKPDIGAATTIQYLPGKVVLLNGSRQVSYRYLLFQYTFLGKLFPSTAGELTVIGCGIRVGIGRQSRMSVYCQEAVSSRHEKPGQRLAASLKNYRFTSARII